MAGINYGEFRQRKHMQEKNLLIALNIVIHIWNSSLQVS